MNAAITLPQAGDEVTAAWGQEVAKALNGIQSGAANVTWAASSVSGVTQVTFPRAYAVAPNVAIASGHAHYSISVLSITTTGCQLQGRRTDGTNQSVSVAMQWIAVGTAA